MRQVHKYYIDPTITGICSFSIASGSKIVHLGMQRKRIAIWFEVDLDEPLSTLRSFRIVGTGEDISEGLHVGTVFRGEWVWHVYEV